VRASCEGEAPSPKGEAPSPEGEEGNSINESAELGVYPNVAKIPYRRVGCAHQSSMISSVKGGRSPPYTYNLGIIHRGTPVTTFQLRFIPVLIEG
jgi:hypothetical protein